MTITRSTTVEQLKEILNANFKAVQKRDKALAESIAYAAKQWKDDPKKVKKSDLADLAKQAMTLLGDKFVESMPAPAPKLAVENSAKPKGGAKLSATGKGQQNQTASQQTTPKADAKADSKVEPPKAQENAPQQQTAPKGDTKTPADKPKTLKPATPEVVTADAFPAELTVGDTKYAQATDIATIADMLKAMSGDEEIVFAFYWSKKQIKQFSYGSGLLPAPANGFEHDLDLSSPLYVSDEGKVCYALSMYTEALYQIMPEAFTDYDGVRYSAGIEFQIYRAVK